MRKAMFAVATAAIGAAVMLVSAGPAQADNSIICVKGGGHVVLRTTSYPRATSGVYQGGKYDGQVLWRHYTY